MTATPKPTARAPRRGGFSSPRRGTGTGTARRRPYDYEGVEQTQLIGWIRGSVMRGTLPADVGDLIYAVPNGGERHAAVAAKLKAQGVRAGVSDLVLPIARGGYFGLYLELKATPPHAAALAASQRDWLSRVDAQGYLAVLAVGVEQAKAVLSEYMTMPATRIAGERQCLPGGPAAGTEWHRP